MTENLVILFDGHCALCNRWVNFVIKRDPQKKFRFAALQSETAQKLTTENLSTVRLPDSILLLEKGKLYIKSTAVLRILRHLGSPWRYTYIFIVIPWFIRDILYTLIAHFRYKLFGKNQACRLISNEEKDLFI
jgi:predicted DCC family thiol-disulfide oxidoreductase YuxK